MRNKYFIKEGQEELNRALLLMKYDSKKTLTENVNNMNEQSLSDVVKQTATGASVGAAAGGLGGAGVGAIPGAVIGGIYGLVRGLSGGNIQRSKITDLIKACTTNKNELGKTTLTVDDYDIMSDNINKAITGLGTDEDAIKAELSKIPTIPDLCGFVSNYNESYGDFISDLDDDLEGDVEWRDYVFIPLRKAIRTTEKASEDKTGEDKTGEDKTDDGKKNLNTRKPDENTKKIQTMLVNKGYYIGNSGPNKDGVDGYYGKKTTAAYEAFNKNESAEDFNQRVYKIGKTQQGGTQQGNVQQGGTQQGNVQQGGTQQGNVQQGGTQQGNVQQGGTPEGEINIINPNDF